MSAGLASLSDVEVVALCDVDESLRPAAVPGRGRRHWPSAPLGVRFPPPARRPHDRRRRDRHARPLARADDASWRATPEKTSTSKSPSRTTSAKVKQMVAAARRHSRVVQSGLQQRSGKHFQSGRRLRPQWPARCRSPGQGLDRPPPQADRPQAGRRAARRRRITRCGSARLRCGRSTPTASITTGTGSGITARASWGTGVATCSTWPAGGWASNCPLASRRSAAASTSTTTRKRPTRWWSSTHIPRATIVWEHRLWSTHGVEGRSAAAAFYGDAGTLVVDRGGWKVYDQSETIASDTSEQPIAHLRNFVDCIKSRSQPAADIETGHISSALCHLGNIAYRVGREVAFDPATRTVTGDRDADLLLSRAYRSPWTLPTV